MSIIIQVLIGLLTTLVGFALGLTWQVSSRRIIYWRARRFWRPFMSGDLKIVIGRFRDFDKFEASGLVGVGDMQAAAEVVAFFDDLGFRRLGGDIDIVYHDKLAGDLYTANLICIGGPDVNQVTEQILKRINRTIEVGDQEQSIAIHDSETGELYTPEMELNREKRETITLDYGYLVKAPNPFDSNRNVLVFAGSYGYGTWAGVKLARSRQFLSTPFVSKGMAVECLYKTEVVEEIPQRLAVVLSRRIPP